MIANGPNSAAIETEVEDLVYKRRSGGRGGFGKLGGASSVGLGLEAVEACLLEGEKDVVHETGNEWYERMDSIKMRRYESNGLIGPFFLQSPCSVSQTP